MTDPKVNIANSDNIQAIQTTRRVSIPPSPDPNKGRMFQWGDDNPHWIKSGGLVSAYGALWGNPEVITVDEDGTLYLTDKRSNVLIVEAFSGTADTITAFTHYSTGELFVIAAADGHEITINAGASIRTTTGGDIVLSGNRAYLCVAYPEYLQILGDWVDANALTTETDANNADFFAVFSIENDQYVKMTRGDFLSGLALSGHNHDGVYSPVGHNHSGVYAAFSHNHSGVYSEVGHNHDSAYAALAHTHAGVYSEVGHNHSGVYSEVGHNHDSAYAALVHDHAGVYAVVGHNHNDLYAALVHNHDSDYAAIGHNHSGVYSEVGHNHDGAYSAIGHNHSGVYAPVSHTHAVADITDFDPDDYYTSAEVDSGFAVIGHNHSGVYSEVGHNHDGDYAAIGHVSNTSNPHSVTASQVGLGTAANAEFSTLELSAGNASAPPLHFNNDPNTGIYHYSADILGFTAGGVNAFNIGSNAIYAATPLEVVGDVRLFNTSNDAIGVALRYQKSRAGGAIQNGDIIGDSFYIGTDSTPATGQGGIIRVVASQNWTPTAHGTNIQLWSTPLDSTTITPAIIISIGGTYLDGDLYPMVDDTYDLGFSNLRWDNIYATNGTIQTSDYSQKRDIESLDKRQALNFSKALTAKEYRMVSGVRKHTGFVAQDVKVAFASVGLDASDYGVYIEQDLGTDEDGKDLGTFYGLRYSELIPFAFAAIQELSEQIERLEQRLQ